MTAAAWALRLGLPPGLLSRQMVLMCVFNLLLHAKPSEPHLVRARARLRRIRSPTLAPLTRRVASLRGRCRTSQT
jgi:hypothetical protein